MTLADFVRTARRHRKQTPKTIVRRSRGNASAVEVKSIESGAWERPPSEVLEGIAAGLEPNNEQYAADLWAAMMRLSGQLSTSHISAIKRLAA